ncbi:MAG: hypothetical protein NT062_04680, partial [Proteobacteria bacterium]|nr:hypothetical protein [Pseudomonadota bacterium]
MVHTLRSAFLLSLLSSVASGCLAQGSAGFGVGGTTTGPSGPPPVAAGDGAVGTDPSVQSGYGGPAGPMAPGAPSSTTAKPGEPRWDDFAFAVRERSGSYYGPWIISKLTTFKVGAACYAKLGDKDSGSLNQTSYYIRNVAALAKAWTGDDWGQIE